MVALVPCYHCHHLFPFRFRTRSCLSAFALTSFHSLFASTFTSCAAECLFFLRASCRIRTNDPEITNHVLWPTELKRRVGKLSASRRYNQVPLLRSSPGGFRGSWPYRTYPYGAFRSMSPQTSMVMHRHSV